MEHAQPLDRPFPWRTTVLATGLLLAVALLVGGGLALAHRQHVTRPAAPTTGRTSKATRFAVPLSPRSRISVLVLNGNGISGAAGTEATRLLSAGYRHAVPTNGSQGYATSLVLFRPGWRGEAQRLAHDARIRTVAPLDGSLPGADAAYRLVVILGAK